MVCSDWWLLCYQLAIPVKIISALVQSIEIENCKEMASGKETGEYRSVLKNRQMIIDHLQENHAKDQITMKYIEHQWIDITASLSGSDIITFALNRISADPRQYDAFMDMLRDIVGMEMVVKEIEGIY